MNEKTRIVWIDGMPCIVLDTPHMPRVNLVPTLMHGKRFGAEIHILRPKDYTDLQRSKEKEFFQGILKEIEKFFRGE